MLVVAGFCSVRSSPWKRTVSSNALMVLDCYFVAGFVQLGLRRSPPSSEKIPIWLNMNASRLIWGDLDWDVHVVAVLGATAC